MSESQRGRIEKYLRQIVVPKSGVKKGENGRVLVLGGSKLFHAASFWSAAMAAKVVDMVHFSSPAMENNEMMRVRAKSKFWEGIVVSWEDVDHYIEEDDTVLIGPGMERGEETKEIVDGLLTKYPKKKWVVDGGALQEINPRLLNELHIITPNKRELDMLVNKITNNQITITKQIRITNNQISKQEQVEWLAQITGVTVLAKGEVDIVCQQITDKRRKEIVGVGRPHSSKANVAGAGMVKGGTGDVLSGLVAGLYAKSPAMASCVTASYVNKRAGEKLAEKRGPYFSPQELLETVPEVLWDLVK